MGAIPLDWIVQLQDSKKFQNLAEKLYGAAEGKVA
jgi:hypothetical protein